MSYTNQPLIEALIGRELTDNEVTILPFVLSSVDSYINSETGLAWTAQDETRYFDGGTWDSIGNILFFPAASDVTAIAWVNQSDPIQILNTYVDGEDYILGPLNSDYKNYVEFRSQIWPGTGNVAVTATWGSGGVPEDIIYAATYLAGKYIRKGSSDSSSPAGNISKESIEGYSREYAFSVVGLNDLVDDLVRNILDKYTEVFL